LAQLANPQEEAHLAGMSQPICRATERPKGFVKPAHWSNEPAPSPAAPAPEPDPAGLSPTRYGDWVKDGVAIDF
jgi:hypothetical protein